MGLKMKNATLFLSLLLSLASVLLGHAETKSVTDFNTLVDNYFDLYFSFHPTEATGDGFHQYDDKLEDYSASARAQQIRGLQEYLKKFEAIDGSKLPPYAEGDRQWIISSIHSGLLELKDIQMWKKDPDGYTSGVTNSIFVIMKRNYAAPEERLRAAIARERQIPKALDYWRQNLKNPPKIYTEIALEQLPDETDFFRKDVPEAFSEVKDPKLLEEFKTANQGV